MSAGPVHPVLVSDYSFSVRAWALRWAPPTPSHCPLLLLTSHSPPSPCCQGLSQSSHIICHPFHPQAPHAAELFIMPPFRAFPHVILCLASLPTAALSKWQHSFTSFKTRATTWNDSAFHIAAYGNGTTTSTLNTSFWMKET